MNGDCKRLTSSFALLCLRIVAKKAASFGLKPGPGGEDISKSVPGGLDDCW